MFDDLWKTTGARPQQVITRECESEDYEETEEVLTSPPEEEVYAVGDLLIGSEGEVIASVAQPEQKRDLTQVQQEASSYLEAAMARLKEAMERAFPGDVYAADGLSNQRRYQPVRWMVVRVTPEHQFVAALGVNDRDEPFYEPLDDYSSRCFEHHRAMSRLMPDILDTLARICAKS